MIFSELGLAEPLLQAISEQGYEIPTPIQQQAIPAVLSGRDLMAAAQTGTGKTAGFTLPMLHRLLGGQRVASNHIRALVLTPTRELAAQVGESVRDYGKHVPLTSTVVFGGVSINPQMMALRRGVDVLVATPGRLLDLYNQNAVKFSQVEILVLDEADRMLDMGFIRDIRKILDLLPKRRQNLLFSATFSDDIIALTKGLLRDPLQISVSPRNTTAQTVKQSVYLVDKAHKTALLSHLVRTNQWEQVLVFARTKHGANRLAEKLERDGITAAAIHGNKSQGARTKALADFKQNNIRVLVATDIAARGLDIEQLPHVVNFELPNVPEDYVHRIGRTGRAGATGEALSLVEPEENKFLKAIEKLIKQTLPREDLPVISAAPKSALTTAVPSTEADDAPRKAQHRPKNRRTKSQKNEARKALGLPAIKCKSPKNRNNNSHREL
jgi:ATP-dependent RNA helicase RhlE